VLFLLLLILGLAFDTCGAGLWLFIVGFIIRKATAVDSGFDHGTDEVLRFLQI
jgi:hypothetical protein